MFNDEPSDMAFAFIDRAKHFAMSRELADLNNPRSDITRLCAMYVAAARQAEREDANLLFADEYLLTVLRRRCGLGVSEAQGWLYGGRSSNEWYIENND